ncbi:hypothetical protein QR98_0049600 [Sarcoptes scabiei]|uniref:Uncharacterized protein n=1 Tax=Sarcoptes scabiei TaxID=52283 RepID=A0A132A679_SARSC|nr:hypothetical protein QR98_0049600 [Sarcoptes scabiei]
MLIAGDVILSTQNTFRNKRSFTYDTVSDDNKERKYVPSIQESSSTSTLSSLPAVETKSKSSRFNSNLFRSAVYAAPALPTWNPHIVSLAHPQSNHFHHHPYHHHLSPIVGSQNEAIPILIPTTPHYYLPSNPMESRYYGGHETMPVLLHPIPYQSSSLSSSSSASSSSTSAIGISKKIASSYGFSVPCSLEDHSETHPIYVLPPKNFQPIVYHDRNLMNNLYKTVPLVYGHYQLSPFRQYQKKIPSILIELKPTETTSSISAPTASSLEEEDSLTKKTTPMISTKKKITDSNEIIKKLFDIKNDYFHMEDDSVYQTGIKSDEKQEELKSSMPLKDKHKIILVPVNDTDFDSPPIFEASGDGNSFQNQIKDDRDYIKIVSDIRNRKSFPALTSDSISINPYSDPLMMMSLENGQAISGPKSSIQLVNQKKKMKTLPLEEINQPNRSRFRQPYRTKLPVGLTSFFLGGTRGVSGRHWGMPANLVKRLEFMPNMKSDDIGYHPDDQSDTDFDANDRNSQSILNKDENDGEIDDSNASASVYDDDDDAAAEEEIAISANPNTQAREREDSVEKRDNQKTSESNLIKNFLTEDDRLETSSKSSDDEIVIPYTSQPKPI